MAAETNRFSTSPTQAELLRDATSGPESSPFDYIIVGSGAGGGPLAARLALAGRCVLLIDAGTDAAEEKSTAYPKAEPGEIYGCPGYHGAATEDPSVSWQFSVRHYANTARQKLDEKYNQAAPPHRRFLDPDSRGEVGHGGILYPRSASLGGCTSHHAMIVAVPNDRDWDEIADLTGDDSWRASQMRGYFTRLERCLYLDAYKRWFQRLLGPLYSLWQWLVLLFDPRAVLDQGGHGTQGWQPTSFIDPQLIEGIQTSDRGFVSLLFRSALAVLHSDNRLLAMLKRSLIALRIVQHIDPNDLNTRRTSPEGAFLIPTGIQSDPERPLFGRRVGVREFVLQTREQHPDRLVIKTRTHVTRVLFDPPQGEEPPRAVGIEAAEGDHLYEASPLQKTPAPGAGMRYFARREVILCGGAFNTPQLLMLSGIGDAEKLAALPPERGAAASAEPICVLRGRGGQPLLSADGEFRRIDLPGVGRNLQDRYEVSVISELDKDFATLANASFSPGDASDPVRSEWMRTGGGLYRTNGGTLAVLRRSSALGADHPEPDLFTFGAPAAFRGYYWGWSRDLLRRTLAAPTEQRNLWSWIILKAYTSNQAGRVTLRSANPFDQPEICFDSFNEKAEERAAELERERAGYISAGRRVPAELEEEIAAQRRMLADSERDLAALMDAVAFMREVNARNPQKFVKEIQPGANRPNGSGDLKEWVRTQAWGHHASCTCRMGSDRWQKDAAKLRDRRAVLDSRFRVHGVRGLRVVDASAFPKIPGYFILTPILMMSEKAADVLLAEPGDEVYPPAFRARETAALHARRARAYAVSGQAAGAGPRPGAAELPPAAVGLALSGGGIRSATFALGVLQALAARNRLREIDFLSTVSGGGFIGSFLGRLFTRDLVASSKDPVGRVQAILLDDRSGPLRWLRTQANYLFATGAVDLRQGLAVLWRNIFSVHLIIGSVLFATFGVLVVLSSWLPPAPSIELLKLSPWWWAPLAAFLLGVLPATNAFWLSQKIGSYRPYPVFALAGFFVLLAGALWSLQMRSALAYAAWGLVTLLLSWVWQEVTRSGIAPVRELNAARQHLKRLKKRGAVSDTQRAEFLQKEAAARQQAGAIVRNRLTRGLGEAVTIFAALTAFVILDTLALSLAADDMAFTIAKIMVALSPALPLLRYVGIGALRQVAARGGEGLSLIRIAKLVGIPLALLLLMAIDMFAHRLFAVYPHEAMWAFGLTAAFSGVIGRAFDFLNLSSLRATYGARLTRTFLGASNTARVYGAASEQSQDVQAAHPDDDMPHDQYHPEAQGGPLHLINVCINETVDATSERELRERKGISMCVTPHGVAVGRRYFAEWAPPDALPRWQKRRRWRDGIDAEDELPIDKRRSTALQAIQQANDPNAFHVLRTKTSDSAEVEPLSLGTWTAISGAAFSTGIGRGTTLPLAVFMGLVNIRLGYWWDSGILPQERPGRYPLPLWRQLKRLPAQLFCMQSMLISEWRARFRGPSEWFWYLSDGGHFEVTGLYELLRRRLPFVIVTDAGEDPDYQLGDIAQLEQQVRVDFGAHIDWLYGVPNGPPPKLTLPPWIDAWIDAGAIGHISRLGRSCDRPAALARVTYDGSDAETWLLLIKPSVTPAVSQDVRNYAAQHPSFPQESTFDQTFDDSQWESYRALGQQIGLQVLR